MVSTTNRAPITLGIKLQETQSHKTARCQYEKNLASKKISAYAGKNQGPDYFHPSFLKESKDLLIEPLKIIFQK